MLKAQKTTTWSAGLKKRKLYNMLQTNRIILRPWRDDDVLIGLPIAMR